MKRTLRRLRHSLRGRLLAGTLTWILVTVLLAGWALSDLFRQHVVRQLSAELTVHMNQLVAALTVDEHGVPTLAFEPSDPRLRQPYSGLYWQVDQLTGTAPPETVFRSRSLWDQTLQTTSSVPVPTPDDGLSGIRGPENRLMLAQQRTVRPPEGTAAYRLTVAADSRAVDDPLEEFRNLMAVFLGVLALGLTVAAVIQVFVGLRPLALLRQRLAEVRAGRVARIEGRFPDEVQPLVQEFNAVLQDNDEIVERARTQAGNLAHALKTPLSVLANAAAHEQTPFGRLVAEQVEVAGRQVEHHLARARAAAAVRSPGRRAEVAPAVQGLARVLMRLYAGKGVRLDTEAVPRGMYFRGEQPDLQEMLGNLMDNACKWAGGSVRVSARLEAASPSPDRDAPRTILLSVDDDGPGLPPEQHDAIFQRGVRMDERKPGSGLGLAIVRDLATAYGGSVSARMSSLGGLGVDLRLPGEMDEAGEGRGA